MHSMPSVTYVIIQFSCLIFFGVSGPLLASQGGLIMLEVLGLLLGGWAIVVMNPLKVSVFPEPRSEGELIESGPYRWIRHPMYTSLLLICLALVLDRERWEDLAVFAVLVGNQVLKIQLEESLLKKKYPEYEEYCSRTHRLIPYIY